MAAATGPAVVLDTGTGYTKVGWAGNVEPSFVLPTAIATAAGRPGAFASRDDGALADLDFAIGDEALGLGGGEKYNVTYPVSQGTVDNWDHMERYWQQVLFRYLRCEPEGHNFMLTEPPLNPPENRELTAEIMFESFGVAGLYIGVQATLALAASYSTNQDAGSFLTGTVIDSGDGVTHVIPVSDGYVLGSSIKSIPIAGRDLTRYIQYCLRERGEPVPPEDSLDVARAIKEKYCYTCSDIVKEFHRHHTEPGKYVKQHSGTHYKTGAWTCDVGYERFLAPEVFFNPEIFSTSYTTPLSELVDDAIQSAPIDTRRNLYKNIALSGGTVGTCGRRAGRTGGLTEKRRRCSRTLGAGCRGTSRSKCRRGRACRGAGTDAQNPAGSTPGGSCRSRCRGRRGPRSR